MGQRAGWVECLIVASCCAGVIGCANRPANPQTAGRPDAPLGTVYAASKAAQLGRLETELRGRLVSTDAMLVGGNPGQIRIRVVAQALFLADTANLAPDADEILQPLAALLANYRGIGLEVDCYTDDLDSSPAAQGLTQQRAEIVAAYLARHGDISGRIRANGEGASAPIATNSAPEGRRSNRRIELIISALSS
jgi:outer membrane protein OmpA-like peptidoglycan-associated protein